MNRPITQARLGLLFDIHPQRNSRMKSFVCGFGPSLTWEGKPFSQTQRLHVELKPGLFFFSCFRDPKGRRTIITRWADCNGGDETENLELLHDLVPRAEASGTQGHTSLFGPDSADLLPGPKVLSDIADIGTPS